MVYNKKFYYICTTNDKQNIKYKVVKFILMSNIYNYKKDLLRPTKFFIIQTETNSLTFGVEFVTKRNIIIHFLMSLN